MSSHRGAFVGMIPQGWLPQTGDWTHLTAVSSKKICNFIWVQTGQFRVFPQVKAIPLPISA
jgi:hypothetical protein